MARTLVVGSINCLIAILGVLFLSVRSDLANHVTKAATKVGIIFKESVYSVHKEKLQNCFFYQVE